VSYAGKTQEPGDTLHHKRSVIAAHAGVLALALPIGASLAAPPALAAAAPGDSGDAPAPVALEEAGTSSRAVYHPHDFARFAPRNALDMLRNVPGFVLRTSDEARGLGQASENVLIDGKRMASKSDGLEARLSRIPAANVVRIEIADGASLDVPGLSGQVANIVTSGSSGVTGQFNWHGQARRYYAHPGFAGGDASIKGSQGKVEYTIALANEQSRGAAGGLTRITGAGGNLQEERRALLTSDGDRPKLSASLVFDGPGTSVGTLNASYRQVWERYDDRDDRAPILGTASQRIIRSRGRSHDHEIGGDFEFVLGPGRLKLIGLDRFERSRDRDQAVFAFADSRPDEGDRYTERSSSGERIGRAEYGWKAGSADWQVALEGAFNRLDKQADLFELDGAGQFVPLPFPGGDGGVRESRYEVSLSHSRPLARKLTMQLVVAGETSTIRQTRAETGTEAISRTFRRPKGSLTLAWTPEQGLDLSLNLARKVGQLDFGDFLASAYLEQGNQDASNLDLMPQQSWETELRAGKDMGVWGSTNLLLFHRRYEDWVDLVPLPGGVEGNGNIASAHESGAEWTTTLQLDRLGLKGAKIDTTAILRRSSLRDPLTGEHRQFGSYLTREFDLEFRHDVPSSNWAWGGAFHYTHYTPYYRIREVGRDYEGPLFGNLFIEHKDVMGLTVKFLAGNLYDGRQRLIRTVFAGPRGSSPVLFRENRDRRIGPIFHLYVSGNF